MTMKLVVVVAVAAASQGCSGSSKQASHEASPTGDRRASGASCDDVSCLLIDQQSPCCRALPPAADTLDHEQFDATMSTLAGAADQCASRHHYDGYFVVSITINADGSVASVGKPPALAGSLNPDLLGCIGDVVRTARFASTDGGATLSYPFELHSGTR